MLPSPASMQSPYDAPSSSSMSEKRVSNGGSTASMHAIEDGHQHPHVTHHHHDGNDASHIHDASQATDQAMKPALQPRSSMGESSAAAIAQQAPPAAYLRTSRISCDPCRRRKLRCDRVMPCSTCVRRGISDRCYQDVPVAPAEHDLSAAQAGPSNLNTLPMQMPLVNGLPAAAPAINRPSPNGSAQKRPRHNGLGTHADTPDGRRSSRSSLAGPSGSSPNSREEELESMLDRYRQELLTLSTTARESSQALEMAMRALSTQQQPQLPAPFPSAAAPPGPPKGLGSPIQGTGPNGLYVWRDLSNALPPIDQCEILLTFYFEQLSIYIKINQRSAVEGMWERLQNGEGIGENAVRIISTMLAFASGTAPVNAGVPKFAPKDHFRWVALMGSPLVSRFGEPVDNSYERILAIALLAIYFLFTGSNDRLWECLGAGIRRGYAHGLYDERSRSWDDTSPLEKEYRRRLAWYMVSLERWQAFMRQLPFALHPDYVHLAEPTFEPDEVIARRGETAAQIVPTFPMTLSDGRLQTHVSANSRRVVKFVFIELVAVCHDYLNKYSAMTPQQRYSRAAQIDELLENKLVEGLNETGIEHHQDLHFLRYLTCATLDTAPRERHLEVNLWVSSIFFLRCLITRRFLTDDQAPQHLRFVGLTYAQGILSTIPMLTRLVKEGRIPLQMTWNANHLLCAATTFAVVILGHDPYHGIDDAAQGRAQNGMASNSRINKNLFPREQVQWLADNIFTTLECLGTLVARGNMTASVAKRILERLCGSQGELQTLYRRRFNTAADGGDDCITPTMLTKTVRDGNAHVANRNNDGSQQSLAAPSSTQHHAQQSYAHSPSVRSPLGGPSLPSLYPQSSPYYKGGSAPQHERAMSGQSPSSLAQYHATSGNASRYDARPHLPPLGKFASQQMQGASSYGGGSQHGSSLSSPSMRGHASYGSTGSSSQTTMAGMSDHASHNLPPPYELNNSQSAYDALFSMDSLHPTATPGSASAMQTAHAASMPHNHATSASAPRSTTINASSLLDAVLMEPVDLDFLGECNTSDLLASLLQQDSVAVGASGGP